MNGAPAHRHLPYVWATRRCASNQPRAVTLLFLYEVGVEHFNARISMLVEDPREVVASAGVIEEEFGSLRSAPWISVHRLDEGGGVVVVVSYLYQIGLSVNDVDGVVPCGEGGCSCMELEGDFDLEPTNDLSLGCAAANDEDGTQNWE
jgi:hypothetical protein